MASFKPGSADNEFLKDIWQKSLGSMVILPAIKQINLDHDLFPFLYEMIQLFILDIFIRQKHKQHRVTKVDDTRYCS